MTPGGWGIMLVVAGFWALHQRGERKRRQKRRKKALEEWLAKRRKH